jgi:peptidoglycan/xylan/chitin deacetylase (PgdA/CDA1 family)
VWRRAYEAVGGFDPAVNMGADRHLGQRLRQLGAIVVDKGLVVLTSARRYQAAFWPTVRMYVLNDLSMVVSGRPHFFDFPDIRRPVRRYIPRVPVRRASAAAVFSTALLLIALSLAEAPGTQMLGPVLARAREVEPLVALTFDDGPSSHTGEVLDVLSRYGVHATFFAIGINVERRPELARRIVSAGHAIGNHTYDHPLWAAVEDASRVRKELELGEQAIETATGVYTAIFRPPHGWRSPWMIEAARREGYLVVTWSVSPDDWRRPSPRVIAERVLQSVTPGGIVLLHDGLDLRLAPPVQNTVQALPEIIEGLQARGYRFVTVPELVAVSNAKGVVPEPVTRAAF